MEAPDKKSIDRTLRNTASPEEARAVIRWFATPEGNRYLSTLMDRDMNEITPGSEARLIDHAIPTEEMFAYIMDRVRWQRRRRMIFRAAAILIPAILLIAQFIYMNSRVDFFDTMSYEEIIVPKGERMQVVFQDGSKATLNSGSRMRYPRKFAFSERKVELEGQGFFEVASLKSRPFKVDLKGIEVKVLGTTFDTKAYPDDREIFISLETGSIVLDALSHTIARLKPGEKAIYNKETGACRIISQNQIERNSAWKDNLIIFEHTPLSEVIATLERYYNVTFVIEDKKALEYSYTLTTSRKQIREILLELEKITPVRFNEKEGEITVTIKK